MFKYTTTIKKKIEEIYKESGYLVRYERGSFNAGYCILEQKKVVVINKFFGLEAQTNSLIEILGKIKINLNELSEESQITLEKVSKAAVQLGFKVPELVTGDSAGGTAEVVNTQGVKIAVTAAEGSDDTAEITEESIEESPAT